MEALLTEDCTPKFLTNGFPSSVEFIQKAIQNAAAVTQKLKEIFG